MFRKVISTLCAAVILFTCCCFSMRVNADSTSVRNRKIVSVVYDDSGSMAGEKWEYTNYAMQCFAAMLNKEDRLDITYMSSYSKGSLSVDTGNRAQSVQNIRNHTTTGGTPVEAVDAAFKVLNNANDTNVNTQYWLIIMTDGQMTGAEDKVNKLAEKTMPNGTKPHIIYLTLCDTNGTYTPSFSKKNIENRSALTASEIIGVISDIACDIAGRFPVDAADIKVLDSKTVEVTTDLPLINMGILTQRSSAKVVSIVDREAQSLQEDCNVHVEAPGHFPGALSADEAAALKGNVALFNAASGNIPAGTYTITFSEDISKDDLVIMFEPAYELRLEVYADGNRIQDLSQLTEGAKVDIEAVLYETGTHNRIAMGMLPNGYKTTISLSENGKEITSEKDLRLDGVTLKPVETCVTATLDVPGFFTVSDIIRFTPEAIVLSGMTAEIHYDGSERLTDENGNPDGENVIYITDLHKNESGVKFTLFIEGQPISKDKAIAIKEKFADSLNLDFSNYDITVCDDGTLVVSPTKTWMPSLIYWMFHNGNSVISSTYDGITASETICFKIGDLEAAVIEFVNILLIVAAILYIILWIFVKPHFMQVGIVESFKAPGLNATYVSLRNTMRIHWLAASGPLNFFGLLGMKKRLKGTKFYVRAVRGGGYTVHNVKRMYVSNSEHYPSTFNSPCLDNSFYFSNAVYIFDGNSTYYKIVVR